MKVTLQGSRLCVPPEKMGTGASPTPGHPGHCASTQAAAGLCLGLVLGGSLSHSEVTECHPRCHPRMSPLDFQVKFSSSHRAQILDSSSGPTWHLEHPPLQCLPLAAPPASPAETTRPCNQAWPAWDTTPSVYLSVCLHPASSWPPPPNLQEHPSPISPISQPQPVKSLDSSKLFLRAHLYV